MTYDGPSLAILVSHDNAEREYAYESVAGTFDTDEWLTHTCPSMTSPRSTIGTPIPRPSTISIGMRTRGAMAPDGASTTT